ncbi:MAG: DNA polymerase III subunit delta' [Pseudohongiellaceae bacterium]
MTDSDTSHTQLQAPLPWQQAQWQQLRDSHARRELANAYLLSGAQGLGKLLFATGFARAVLCDKQAEQEQQAGQGTISTNDGACGQCSNCRLGSESLHPDIQLVAVGEGSRLISVDQIRDLAEFIHHTSHAGKWKFVVVPDAHCMNLAAANALLKTLEEPSPATTLFLISDLPGRLLPTVRSRCQKIQFPTPGTEQGLHWLESQLTGQPCRELLAMAKGRPLAALQLADTDGLATRQQFTTRLEQLWQGTIGIEAVCKEVEQLDVEAMLEHLSGISSMLVRAVLNIRPAQTAETSSELQSLQQVVREQVAQEQTVQEAASSAQTQHSIARRLLMFSQDVNQAIRQIRSGTNPNIQLMLESLLFRWQSVKSG